MAPQYGKQFQTIARKLRREFPLSCPLRIVCKGLEKQKLCGSCIAYLKKDGSIARFVIEVDTQLATLSAIDTLLHEYAHALDQDINGVAAEPHRASWGVCYAQIWRFYVTHFT